LSISLPQANNYISGVMTVNPVERVRQYLARFPFEIQVTEFVESTGTAEQAARAVGVDVGQIAKSVLLLIGDQPVMVVTSGDAKVSQSRLKQRLGLTGKVKMPDAETTMAITGFPPGGVCPFALPGRSVYAPAVRILVDASMSRFPLVYIAAGSPCSAAPVTVEQLLAITGGEPVDICDLRSDSHS
jgi:prolyl-tRNA editing enzyme YbaK/EbsC (Cys-tRNA(Pro) deacylase)